MSKLRTIINLIDQIKQDSLFSTVWLNGDLSSYRLLIDTESIRLTDNSTECVIFSVNNKFIRDKDCKDSYIEQMGNYIEIHFDTNTPDVMYNRSFALPKVDFQDELFQASVLYDDLDTIYNFVSPMLHMDTTFWFMMSFIEKSDDILESLKRRKK